MLTICWLLDHNLLTTFWQLAHNSLTIWSLFAHNLLTTWSSLAHYLPTTCSPLAHQLLTTCSLLAHHLLSSSLQIDLWHLLLAAFAKNLLARGWGGVAGSVKCKIWLGSASWAAALSWGLSWGLAGYQNSGSLSQSSCPLSKIVA